MKVVSQQSKNRKYNPSLGKKARAGLYKYNKNVDEFTYDDHREKITQRTCVGKTPIESLRLALERIDYIHSLGVSKYALGVYKCSFCRKYHLTKKVFSKDVKVYKNYNAINQKEPLTRSEDDFGNLE